jgi:catechol 2,3-dioxygenase-like lactoylglutathione lyase family enzyme
METIEGNLVRRIHLALNTQYFPESIEFYKALLGVEPTKLKPGYAKFESETPALNLTLNETRQAPATESIIWVFRWAPPRMS